jgi:hypothetical protein
VPVLTRFSFELLTLWNSSNARRIKRAADYNFGPGVERIIDA